MQVLLSTFSAPCIRIQRKRRVLSFIKMRSVANRNRLPDSLINASIKRLYKPGNTIVRIGPGFTSPLNDSINYWLKQRAVSKSLNVLDRSEILTDTLATQLYKDVKTMNFDGDLYIVNTREMETEDYTAFFRPFRCQATGYSQLPDFHPSYLERPHPFLS
jgi:hypothetical protein